MRLQSKIIYAVLPLVITPILILGWLSFLQMKSALLESKHQEMRVRLQQVEMQFTSLVDTATANIELFSGSRILHQYVVLESEEDRYEILQPTLLTLFSGYQKAYPEYMEIRVIYPDGYEDTRLARVGLKNIMDDESQSPLFKALSNSSNESIWLIDRNIDNGEQVIYVGRKIIINDPSIDVSTAHPKLRAYLALTVSMEKLQNLINETVIGQVGRVFATNHDGRVVFCDDSLSRYGVYEDKVLEGINKLKLSGEHAELKVNGEDVQYIGRKMHENFNVYALLPETELQDETRNLGVVIALITLGAMLVTVMLTLLFLKKMIISPLQLLSAAASDVGKGKMDVSLDINTRDEIGELAHVFKSMSRNLAATNERIKFLAYHDPLTGLPNRRMFHEYLEHALSVATRNNTRVALLFLDVDNFKNINDKFGHQTGDEFLVELSERFSTVLRGSDYLSHANPTLEYMIDSVSRLGGDEFTFILTNINQEYVEAKVAKRLLDALSEPMKIESQKIIMTGSIGITLYPDDAKDADTLIRNADIAMYHAKQSGKNNYQYFTQSINEAVQEKLIIESRLHQAMDNNELSLLYQPLVNTITGEIIGCEALLRWNSPDLGMISPATFIPMAEENGLIVSLGNWVLEKVFYQIQSWQRDNFKVVPVSVNVSGVQLRRDNLAGFIKGLLDESAINPALLTLELTESTLIEAVEHSINTLTEIKALGVRIALDDFGTGYSSLSYLRKFQIDVLKIDRSFVRDIETRQDDAELTRAIIALAHSLDLPVIVEGVETKNQRDIIKEYGADMLQGYFFYYPLSIEEFSRKLSQKQQAITDTGTD